MLQNTQHSYYVKFVFGYISSQGVTSVVIEGAYESLVEVIGDGVDSHYNKMYF